MPRKICLILFIFVFIATIIGCSSPTYRVSEKKIAKNVETTTDLLRPAHVVVADQAFIDSKPVFNEFFPPWAEREVNIDLSGATISFKTLMKELFKPAGKVRVIYDAGLADLDITDFVFSGRLVDVIKEVSKNANYHFIIEKMI